MYLVSWRAGDKRRSWLHLHGFVGGRWLWIDGVSRGGRLAGRQLDSEELTDAVDGVSQTGVVGGACRHRSRGVQDGGVVATELARDLGQREVGELARQIHGDL